MPSFSLGRSLRDMMPIMLEALPRHGVPATRTLSYWNMKTKAHDLKAYLVVVFVALLLMGLFWERRSQSAAPKAKKDTLAIMHDMRNELIELQPYLVSEAKFLDPKSDPVLRAKLKQFASESALVMSQKTLQSTAYRISGFALNHHIQEALRIYEKGNRKIARRMLSATPIACYSCHSQLPHSPIPLWELRPEQLSGTSFEKAEILFATRNYDAALPLYGDTIRTYSKGKPNGALLDQISTSLKRKLVIYVRLKRDFAGAIANLTGDLPSAALRPEWKQNIKSWQTQLKALNEKPQLNPAKDSEAKILARAREILEGNPRGAVGADHPHLVDILYASSLLYEGLNAYPKSNLTPEFLYWLAIADFSLNNDFYFSLSDLYLRECITGYPRMAIAKRCYKEYEYEINSYFTGARDSGIPAEVSEELLKFKVQVDYE